MPSASGISVTPTSAMSVAAVYGAVKIRASMMAALPLAIYERTANGDKQYALKDPRYELIRNEWNPYDDSFEAREFVQQCFDIRGNGVAEITWGQHGYPERIQPIWPGDWRVDINPKDGELIYLIKQGNSSKERPVPRDRMFHVRNLRIGHPYLGSSPITVHRETIGRALAQVNYQARLYGNGVQTTGVLEHPGELGEEAIKNLRLQWADHYQGPDNVGKPIILEEGMKYTPITMSPEDAQYVQSVGLSVLDICRIYEMPPNFLGHLDRANFSNIEEQNRDFYQRTLMGIVVKNEMAYNRSLLLPDERGRLFFKFNLDAFLRGNTKDRFACYAIGRQWGWYSANDVRQKEDENRLPGDTGDVYLEPSNMIPAGSERQPQDNQGAPQPASVTPITKKKDKGTASRVAVEQPFVELMASQLRRAVNKECQALKKKLRARGAGEEYREFCATFYNAHDSYLAEILDPVVEFYMTQVPGARVHVDPKELATWRQDYVMRALAELEECNEDASATETLLESWFMQRAQNEARSLVSFLSVATLGGEDHAGTREAC